MHFNGFSGNEIAARLEMSPSTVSSIINSPLGQAYLGGLNDRAKEATLDVRKKLVSLNASALTAIQNILDPKHKAPHSVQLNAAKDVLDRNGYKPPDKSKHRQVEIILQSNKPNIRSPHEHPVVGKSNQQGTINQQTKYLAITQTQLSPYQVKAFQNY